MAAAPKPIRARPLVYTHLVMVAGVITIAVGYKHVIAHPLDHTHLAWIAVILGGPALFLAGRALFEYAVFSRVSRDRPIGVSCSPPSHQRCSWCRRSGSPSPLPSSWPEPP
jgi:low temperature requirement protein LtrA